MWKITFLGSARAGDALAQGLRAEGLDVRVESPRGDGVGTDTALIALYVGDTVFDAPTGADVESLIHKAIAVFKDGFPVGDVRVEADDSDISEG
jgi:hypothetical protein